MNFNMILREFLFFKGFERQILVKKNSLVYNVLEFGKT